MDATTIGTKPSPELLQGKADDLFGRALGGTEEVQRDRKVETERFTKERDAAADDYKKAADDLTSTASQRQHVPLPSADTGPIVDPKAYSDFAHGMLALSLIGAFAGRSHWKGALSALDGALKGFKEGSLDNAKAKTAQFEREYKLAVTKQREADKEYTDVLENKKLSLNMKAQLMQVAASKHQDWQMEAAARQHDYDTMFRLAQQYEGRASQMQSRADALRDKVQARLGDDSFGPGFTEDAKELAAEKYLATGILAPMGGGKRGTKAREDVLNKAAQLMRERGMAPGDIPAAQAGFAANKASLSKLTQQYDAITAFEKTAIRNGDQLLGLADKVDTTGVPVIEKWIRAGRKATGSADVAEFDAQMLVYRTEAAKILMNPNLTGQLTDSARKEVEEFLKGSASAEQIRAVVKRLKTDFENRKHVLEAQIDDINFRMRNPMARVSGGGGGGGGGTVNWSDLK